jgi:hypothetical protein
MKAERRHELQTNSLARFLENLPLYLRFHLTKIIFGLVIIVLLILLVRYRTQSAIVARQEAQTALGDVRRLLGELQVVDLTRPTPDARATERRRIASQAEGAIDAILQQTPATPEDSGLRAEAMVARGDLNWVMSNLPPLPGATTQPVLQMPMSPEEYLAAAESVYQQVLTEHPDRQMSALTARFGLASVAENRNNWDLARQQYETIRSNPDAPRVFREWANIRLQMLPMLQEPIFTGTLPARTAEPGSPVAPPPDLTTAPAAIPLQPSPAPATTQPATQPVQ